MISLKVEVGDENYLHVDEFLIKTPSNFPSPHPAGYGYPSVKHSVNYNIKYSLLEYVAYCYRMHLRVQIKEKNIELIVLLVSH